MDSGEARRNRILQKAEVKVLLDFFERASSSARDPVHVARACL